MGKRVRLEELTERQLQVISLIGSGMTNRQAAAQLWVTEDTVKTHLKRLYDRLDARSAAHAVTILHGAGVLPLPIPEQRAGDARRP